jgi:hypothetical protein
MATIGLRVATVGACLTLATCTTGGHGADVAAIGRELPGVELLEYCPASPTYVAVGDVRALADSATGLDGTPVAVIVGIPALRAPTDAVPWLDVDTISAFAHFGPTSSSTEHGPPMITAITTSQDPGDLAARARSERLGVPSGTNRFVSDAPASEVAGANRVDIGAGVVILAPHSGHLDITLDDGVETSPESPIIEALARAEGNRRIAFVLDEASDCGGVVAAAA